MNEELKNRFSISTDKSKLDISMIHNFLKSSYWAENISKATVEKSIKILYVSVFMRVISKLVLPKLFLIMRLLHY